MKQKVSYSPSFCFIDKKSLKTERKSALFQLSSRAGLQNSEATHISLANHTKPANRKQKKRKVFGRIVPRSRTQETSHEKGGFLSLVSTIHEPQLHSLLYLPTNLARLIYGGAISYFRLASQIYIYNKFAHVVFSRKKLGLFLIKLRSRQCRFFVYIFASCLYRAAHPHDCHQSYPLVQSFSFSSMLKLTLNDGWREWLGWDWSWIAHRPRNECGFFRYTSVRPSVPIQDLVFFCFSIITSLARCIAYTGEENYFRQFWP